MAYRIQADNGALLDARFEIKGRSINLASRGGARTKGGRNTEYGPALLAILTRLNAAGVALSGAWVDSSQVQHLPLKEREVLSPADGNPTPAGALSLIASRMKRIGQAPNARGGGNSTKKLRIDLDTTLDETAIAEILGAMRSERGLRGFDRLPAEMLERVTAEHVWNAVQRLVAGEVDHDFGPSTDYDLIADHGVRLPPKAVFGLAASEALGFRVKPEHFTAGLGSVCFRILERCDFRIVAKGEKNTDVEETTPKQGGWSEGQRRLVAHVRRERARGLSKAKKAAFKRQHGRLFCERCQMDPIATYGLEVGEACIEVHHKATQVSRMNDGHVTKLEDLQCLCASCHRVVHRLARLDLGDEAVPAEASPSGGAMEHQRLAAGR